MDGSLFARVLPLTNADLYQGLPNQVRLRPGSKLGHRIPTTLLLCNSGLHCRLARRAPLYAQLDKSEKILVVFVGIRENRNIAVGCLVGLPSWREKALVAKRSL